MGSSATGPPTAFFFQAEDGIRGVAVTGVQTCALPISYDENDGFFDHQAPFVAPRMDDPATGACSDGVDTSLDVTRRSEERRVGTECRCRAARRTGRNEAAGRVGHGPTTARWARVPRDLPPLFFFKQKTAYEV